MDKYIHLKYCVIIPTYNNSKTLSDVIKGVLKHTTNVIVVNDGSTDNTEELLHAIPYIELISYKKNKGKGHALKQGFNKAIEMGFDYAITIDSDGQHNPDEIPLFLEEANKNPNALIMGIRGINEIKNMPSKNNFANNFSNFWYHFQTGIKLKDTQSGYRLYPLCLFKNKRYFSRKYEFELEVLVRAAWQEVKIVSLPILAYYPPKEERVSHFRPFRDFSRISILNFVLTTLAITYIKPKYALKKFRKKKFKDIIKEDILASKTSVAIMAVSIGFGVFMGIVPFWGYQLIVGFTLAHILKLNKAIFFLAANISIPPMIPLILYLSLVTGSYVLGEGSWIFDFELNFDTIKLHLKQYIIGSLVLAVAAGSFAGLLSYPVLLFIKKIRRK